MNKNLLRTIYKEKRSSLSSEEVEEKSMDIANQLLQLDIWDHSFYHIFLSIPKKNEIDTEPILHILQGKDKNIVLSKSNFKDATLSHFLLTDATVIKLNDWGIPEPVDGIEISPEKLEVVFIPLLAFDMQGNRVGYGKGFYDRFLSQCSGEVIKIGLSFFEAGERIDDIAPNDVPLDYCVTPDRIYKF